MTTEIALTSAHFSSLSGSFDQNTVGLMQRGDAINATYVALSHGVVHTVPRSSDERRLMLAALFLSIMQGEHTAADETP